MLFPGSLWDKIVSEFKYFNVHSFLIQILILSMDCWERVVLTHPDDGEIVDDDPNGSREVDEFEDPPEETICNQIVFY